MYIYQTKAQSLGNSRCQEAFFLNHTTGPAWHLVQMPLDHLSFQWKDTKTLPIKKTKSNIFPKMHSLTQKSIPFTHDPLSDFLWLGISRNQNKDSRISSSISVAEFIFHLFQELRQKTEIWFTMKKGVISHFVPWFFFLISHW